jgi:glycosidase
MPGRPFSRARGGLPRRTLQALAALALASPAWAVAGPLHVPSPDWRDAVVYFAMIDRFDDGEPGNNDQGIGEYDPVDHRRYSGGDLRGLARRLDYIQGLGATAVWITPPVANQWWNPGGSYGGYHGYWASDFSTVDAHYGTLDDYRALSRGLHGRGMHLIQDVVVNHVADWIRCDREVNPDDDASIARHCRLRTDAQGRSAPVQPPFDRNDPQDSAHRREAIYHFTPAIADYSDRRQELDYALADLDDLNTENPVVRRALRKAYGMWIREVGVDAFRVDTAFHVPADFFPDFLHAGDPGAPGIERVARETGRHDFLSFGEGFGSDKPYEDRQARKLDGYMRVPGGLPSMINFPLYGTLGDVFARGRPTAELRHRIENTLAVHADPWRMPTFIDNHDVDRFLAGAGEPALKQALLAMLTLPGIPVIYYGTEQGFRERRRAMFAGGHASGGRDHFDPEAPLYRYLQRAIALRREHKLFSRGTPAVLAANPARAGTIAWRTDYNHVADRSHGGARASEANANLPQPANSPLSRETGEGWGEGPASALVIFNTADTETLLDNLDTGLPPRTRLEPLFAIEGTPDPHVLGEDARLTLVLPPRSGQAWRAIPPATAHTAAPPAEPTARADTTPSPARGGGLGRGQPATLQLHALPATPITGGLAATGTAPGRETIALVVDGDLSRAHAVPVDAHGNWQATLRTDDMVDPQIEHRLVAYDPATDATSPAQTFRVALDWQPAADIEDPRGDDTGPTGRYTYPVDPGWRDTRPADIERIRAWTAGGALRFEVTLRGISTAWNPANGFDHLAITAFLELPGRDDGARAMPLQHADLPGGMRWHRRLRAHGWSNALFAHDGASASHEGTPVSPGAAIAVDHVARTVTFTLPAGALGHPDTLAGARLHVTTWDYDDGYRALAPEAGPTTFGGGADGPRVMDTASLTLRR